MSIAFAVAGLALAGWQARAALPRWMQDAVGGGAIEAALYRAMDLPLVKALYPRPPREAQGQLSELIVKAPHDASLYSLRALEEEQALDFPAAEGDWKSYASRAADKAGAKLELADYYHRRLQTTDEVSALMEVGSSGADPSEAYVADAEQRSWKAFERILALAADQGLDDTVYSQCYAAWIARYPRQPSIYATELHWLLEKASGQDRFDQAIQLISQYRRAFPLDATFPLKASALIEYRRGSVQKAIAIYDSGFEPLWPAELVQSYYALLTQSHQLRSFLAAARARLAHNPDDLNAMARLFYYAQQQGNLAAAQQAIEAYRLSKENRKASWSAQELYTLAQLTTAIHAYPDAARYDFALYHAPDSLISGSSPQVEGLSGVIGLLLGSPNQPLEVGSGSLSMYRDMATIDRGPGSWNGILSLWLNSTYPEQAYHEEEQRAQPYFHRAKAAELLTLLDKKFPGAPQRAELHLKLIQALGEYGEDALVLKGGEEYLGGFSSPSNERNRVAVAMLMADAYARKQDTKGEFALYNRMLTELGAITQGMPLTAASVIGKETAKPSSTEPVQAGAAGNNETEAAPNETTNSNDKKVEEIRAFEIAANQPTGVFVAGAREYQELLERYLGRLSATGQLPQALAVLRKELDRNPNDPLLYERLASFLQQNNLSAQQEEVYNQAIQKFQDKTWYDKLARFYLREKKYEDFAGLTRKVTNIFSGTDLESYFSNVTQGGPELYLKVNLYAYKRFPHDQVFLRNLLQAYQTKQTRDQAAWEKLLREHWADSPELRTQFFDFLSRAGKLDAELAKLHTLVPDTPQQKANSAATRELAEAEMWRSHFEASAPLLGALAEAYPADEELGTQASSLFRSLAYFNSAETAHAVAIEANLLAANPANMDRLARIGDIYSDSGADGSPSHENLEAAAPYWRRMPQVHPGTPDGYLQAATVFWDYFQFDDALGEIHEAQAKFHHPALFGYETGAIDEGKRDLTAAIHEYVQAATQDSPSEAAATRLMQLARRKASAKAVDAETASAVEAGYSISSLSLRERVLKVQKRTAEIGLLLEAALGKATSYEQAQAIGAQAQAQSLTTIYEHALQRQIALAGDPVEKIELSYDLVRSYEGRKDLDDATRTVSQVYGDNPKLLGVVRATTDFYWRNKQSAKAIATLTEAADGARPAQPALSRKLVVEAANKANDSGSYAQARALMAPLIDSGSAGGDPYNPQYLSVEAESYARAGDDAALKQFYLSELASIRNATASMSAEERKQKTVLLRRGLIPALTRMKDYTGAVEQYIAILSAFPEDMGASQEASLYALRYGRQRQLIEFVNNTVKASPKDSRFAILLAQILTASQDYPAAIDAYAHAIAIRSDRADDYTAKAELEERLQRLDDACKEYERLYVLSYKNPDWMLKIAAVRARQGRKDEAVKALERAWIEGHSATASDYFKVATQLEAWNMLDESLRFADLGVKAEGDMLLAGADPGHQNGEDALGASVYARLMTRLRKPEKVLAVLDEARKAADASPNSPSLIVQQVEKQGLASVTDSEWRRQRIQRRKTTAEERFRAAVLEMGKAVAAYFTPEEKQQFASLVDARSKQADTQLWIDAASSAGIKDEEAKLRRQLLLKGDAEEKTNPHLAPYIELERSRMEYQELAETMDAYAAIAKPPNRAAARLAEVEAYRSAGDEAAELRVLRTMRLTGEGVGQRDRYLQLLLKYDVPGFEAYGKASSDEQASVAAPNYAVAHSDVKIARAALDTRAKAFDEPWQNAYSALSGLYFRDVTPVTETAFHSVLGDERTIGERIDRASHHDQHAQELSGDVWFYYGMRYGVYRTLAPEKDWPQNNPEDLVAAELERSASAVNFIGLARAYTDAGKPANALTEYRHALELAPDSAAVRDSMALLLWQSNKKDAAIQQWREALAALNRIQDKGPAPESFWSGFALIADHLAARKLTSQLHPDMDAVLRNYIARNGNYRSNELLKAAFHASATKADGVAWILSLSTAASDPADVLSDIETMPWLPADSREPVLLREIELARMTAAHADSNESYLAERPAQLEKSLALYYVEQKQDAKAEAAIERLTDQQRKDTEIVEAQIILAARAASLSSLLARYRASADAEKENPTPGVLRNAAGRLDAAGDKASALAIREFLFERGQTNRDLLNSDYLALANARIENGNVTGAVDILRRMTLQPGDVYSHTDEAAALLEKSHEAEAIEFLSVLAKGVPWNESYAVRLARAQLHAGASDAKAQAVAELAVVAADSRASYDLRVEAAMAVQGQSFDASKLGSVELRLLAAGKVAVKAAQQPYFFAARIVAAAADDKAQRAMLLRQAVATDPAGLMITRESSEDAVRRPWLVDAETRNPATLREFSGDALRLAIFRDESAIGRDATALEALQAVLNRPHTYAGNGENAADPTDEEDSDTEANTDTASTEEDFSPPSENGGNDALTDLERLAPLPPLPLESDAAKVELAVMIASDYEHTGSPQDALPYLKLAAYLEKETASHARLQQHVELVNAAIELEAQNALRRPKIQRALDQSGVVRPRLTASQLKHVDGSQDSAAHEEEQ